MAFKKYNSVEKTEIVSDEGHKKIASKTGSRSVLELTEQARQDLLKQLDAEKSAE